MSYPYKIMKIFILFLFLLRMSSPGHLLFSVVSNSPPFSNQGSRWSTSFTTSRMTIRPGTTPVDRLVSKDCVKNGCLCLCQLILLNRTKGCKLRGVRRSDEHSALQIRESLSGVQIVQMGNCAAEPAIEFSTTMRACEIESWIIGQPV
jgi:hypothetical protein